MQAVRLHQSCELGLQHVPLRLAQGGLGHGLAVCAAMPQLDRLGPRDRDVHLQRPPCILLEGPRAGVHGERGVETRWKTTCHGERRGRYGNVLTRGHQVRVPRESQFQGLAEIYRNRCRGLGGCLPGAAPVGAADSTAGASGRLPRAAAGVCDRAGCTRQRARINPSSS